MKLKRGEFLYRMGDTSDAMFIIVSGKIGLFNGSADGAIEVARLGAGQIVGDLSFFTLTARTATARALTDVEFHRIPYETIRKQFEDIPPWVQLMTKTLAGQVHSFATELKHIKDVEDGLPLSKLAVCRSVAALTFVPAQFGTRSGSAITVDWNTLRTFSNLAFREISLSVLQFSRLLEASTGICAVHSDNDGPTEVQITDPELLAGFLRFYVRAMTKNSPELGKIEPVEFHTLQVLANPKLQTTPIHRGQVEIDLSEFTRMASSMRHPDVTATTVDLLVARGLDISKFSTEDGVKLRFHLDEAVRLCKYWQILGAIQSFNRQPAVALKRSS